MVVASHLRFSMLFVSHSQYTMTFHPLFSSSNRTRLSRSTLSRNFFSQNSALDFGVRQEAQPAWRCQKQPWMKTTHLRDGNTTSGFPGSDLACIRNRNPERWRKDRTFNSGVVSLAFTRDITSLRVRGPVGGSFPFFLMSELGLNADYAAFRNSTSSSPFNASLM